MGTFIQFAEILEKKIRKEIERDSTTPSAETSSRATPSLQSELWTHLVGHFDPKRFQNPNLGQAYHRHRPPPRRRPDHRLSPEQEKAMTFMAQHGQVLASNFSSADLKRAFRALALKLHPDQGGSSILFQTLLKVRSDLSNLF